jgi:excisionase family DNA binding protein
MRDARRESGIRVATAAARHPAAKVSSQPVSDFTVSISSSRKSSDGTRSLRSSSSWRRNHSATISASWIRRPGMRERRREVGDFYHAASDHVPPFTLLLSSRLRFPLPRAGTTPALGATINVGGTSEVNNGVPGGQPGVTVSVTPTTVACLARFVRGAHRWSLLALSSAFSDSSGGGGALGVSAATVRRWLARGELEGVRVGGRLRTSEEAVAAIVHSATHDETEET